MDSSNDKGLIGYFNLSEWFDSLSENEKQKMRDYFSAPTGIRFSVSYESLNEDESDMNITPSTGEDYSILEVGDATNYVNRRSPRLTVAKLFRIIGDNAICFKDLDFAEKILKKAFKSNDLTASDRHFICNDLLHTYYRLRNERSDAIEKCIEFCKKDIEHLAEFLNEWKQEALIRARGLDGLDIDKWLKDNSKIIDLKEKWLSTREKWLKDNIKNIKEQQKFKERDLKTMSEWDYPILGIPFSPENVFPPRIPSLGRLARIYEQQNKIKEAIEVCNIALKHGCFDDNTKSGFIGRKKRLQNKLL